MRLVLSSIRGAQHKELFDGMIPTPNNLVFFYLMLFSFSRDSYVEGGRFFAGLAEDAKPVFSGSGAMNSGALILVSMLSTAFVAHFNAPKFYAELKDKSVPRYVFVYWRVFIVRFSSTAQTGWPVERR